MAHLYIEPKIIDEILHKHNEEGMSQAAIGREYGISKTTIRRIVIGQRKEQTEPPPPEHKINTVSGPIEKPAPKVTNLDERPVEKGRRFKELYDGTAGKGTWEPRVEDWQLDGGFTCMKVLRASSNGNVARSVVVQHPCKPTQRYSCVVNLEDKIVKDSVTIWKDLEAQAGIKLPSYKEPTRIMSVITRTRTHVNC